MAVHIRLARFGGKKKPFYRIVAIDKDRQRDGATLENIGTYNPKVEPSAITLKMDRYEYWLSVGALPSDTVKALAKRA